MVTEQQITKNITDESSQVTADSQKQKDPKKVAAGKASRKNAKAKKDNTSLSFFNVSNEIQTVAGFVGACFVLYNGWKFFTSSTSSSTPTSSTSSTPSTPSTPSTSSTYVKPRPNMMGNME